MPLSFAPGEAYQFDWSHEIVVLDGVTTTVKVAHMRLCHSRMLFVRAYPRETQEMVFDAHERAFSFFRGACTRGIYDNMKTAVETIFVGKERKFNRRFAQMCSHHLVEPVACTPASGWEKGQVENQVGLVRERFFTPRLRFKSYDDMNAWLLDKCVGYAKAHPHPEIADKTIWQVFEEERPKLVPPRGRFDGFHELTASVSKTCLVRFDNNKYSVNASAVGAPSRSTLTPTASSFVKKGASSRNMHAPSGAARRSSIPGIMCRFSRASPARCGTARHSRIGCCPERSNACDASSPAHDGDRQMVKILAAVVDDGLAAVEAACAEALAQGVHSADVILNILARRREPPPPPTIPTPESLTLLHMPIADCARYDQLRRTA